MKKLDQNCTLLWIQSQKNEKNDPGKDFFKLMNNVVFTKTSGNVRNHRDMKIWTTEATRNCVV